MLWTKHCNDQLTFNLFSGIAVIGRIWPYCGMHTYNKSCTRASEHIKTMKFQLHLLDKHDKTENNTCRDRNL